MKTSDKGTVVLTNVAPEHPGTPLIDIHGRVIAVANVTEGQGAYVPLPKSWGDAPISAILLGSKNCLSRSEVKTTVSLAVALAIVAVS